MIEPRAVVPLGLFGVLAPQAVFERVRPELMGLSDVLPEHERPLIAAYLRAGAITLAIMEHTRDVINSSFAVAGGSALLTDGTYYWRQDAADYVEHYGTGLPEDFLRHGRQLAWLPRPMTEAEILAVDRYLTKYVRWDPLSPY